MLKLNALQLCVGITAPLRAQEAGLVAVAWKPPSSQERSPPLDLQAWPKQVGEHPKVVLCAKQQLKT